MSKFNELVKWLDDKYSITENKEVFYTSQHNVRCGELKAYQEVIDFVKGLNSQNVDKLAEEERKLKLQKSKKDKEYLTYLKLKDKYEN